VAALTHACHAAAKSPILIAIDQEGGSVARLHDGFTQSPGAMALGAAGSEDLAFRMSKVLATEMRTLGINWDYAPVLDIAHDISNPSVGTRSLGTDKHEVGRLAAAEIRGFQAGGVAATAKHFPGLGNTPVDTHDALAVIDVPFDFLWDNDLVPFRQAIESGVATMMMTHVTFSALDTQYPATLSPAVTQTLLRDKLGFTGVATTDCMEMGAVTKHYTPGESAVLAALAGQDLILFSHTRAVQEAAYDGLLEAARSGRLSLERIDQSVQRIQALKQQYAITEPSNLALIRHSDHLHIADEAARAAVILLQSAPGLLPLHSAETSRIGVIEFASYLESNVAEKGGQTGFVSLLKQHLPDIDAVALRPSESTSETFARARVLAQESDVLVLATRSAHLIPEQLELAREYLSLAKQTVLLCLRNPYDAAVLSGADVVLCTCGDSLPSIHAIVAALMGEFVPTGRLPVPVELDASV
jgi:beta-N-acetylhexosaminidase